MFWKYETLKYPKIKIKSGARYSELTRSLLTFTAFDEKKKANFIWEILIRSAEVCEVRLPSLTFPLLPKQTCTNEYIKHLSGNKKLFDFVTPPVNKD